MLLKALYLTSVSPCHLVQQIYHQGMYLSQASYNYCRSKKIYFTIENIFQDILKDAETYFQKSLVESKNLDKKKIIASEIMRLFYEKIHKKMFEKHININKKIKLSIWDKASIFFNFYIRKAHQK